MLFRCAFGCDSATDLLVTSSILDVMNLPDELPEDRTPSSAPTRLVSMRVVDVYPYRIQHGTPELLLLCRSDRVSYAGTWRMVGGKMKVDETAWQAALRELREETGLVPERFWTLPSLNHFYEWQHDRINLIPAFAAKVSGAPTLNHEHDDWSWVSVDEAAQRLQWPEQQRLARLVASMCAQGVPEALRIPVDEASHTT